MVEREDWRYWEDETGVYVSVTPESLTAKAEDVIAMILGGRTPFLLRRWKEDVENKAVLQDEKKEGGVGCWILSTYWVRRMCMG